MNAASIVSLVGLALFLIGLSGGIRMFLELAR